VTREVVTSLRVPLPPLDEQLRIAGILDTADEVRTKRDATIAAWDSLSRSIFLDMFGNPRTNPKGWRKGTLGEIALFTGGGTPSRARSDYFSGAICWATSKDMKHEFLDDTQEHVTKEAVAGSAAKVVPIGTILVVVKSKVLMHRLPVAIARVETCFGQDLKGITPDSTLGDVHFVAAALRSGQRWLLDRARGANTEGLTLDHLRSFPMVLPPIELQREFAMHVGSITGTKQMAQKSLAVLDELFASIQHRAFSGAL
jgi:type I restriction enzyme S subunit